MALLLWQNRFVWYAHDVFFYKTFTLCFVYLRALLERKKKRINQKLHTLSCRTTCVINFVACFVAVQYRICSSHFLSLVLGLFPSPTHTHTQTREYFSILLPMHVRYSLASVYRFDKRLMLIMIWLYVPVLW